MRNKAAMIAAFTSERSNARTAPNKTSPATRCSNTFVRWCAPASMPANCTSASRLMRVSGSQYSAVGSWWVRFAVNAHATPLALNPCVRRWFSLMNRLSSKFRNLNENVCAKTMSVSAVRAMQISTGAHRGAR